MAKAIAPPELLQHVEGDEESSPANTVLRKSARVKGPPIIQKLQFKEELIEPTSSQSPQALGDCSPRSQRLGDKTPNRPRGKTADSKWSALKSLASTRTGKTGVVGQLSVVSPIIIGSMSQWKERVEGCSRTIVYRGSDVVVSPEDVNLRAHGRPNAIVTARFSLRSWLPKSLFFQFQRIANAFFLVVAVVICIASLGGWSTKSFGSHICPFLAVLAWTALKDLYEDRQRQRYDDEENSRKVDVYDSVEHCFRKVRWSSILVGDVVFLPCDAVCPADLVMLEAGGGAEAYISTQNLDGVSNLKECCPPRNIVSGDEGNRSANEKYFNRSRKSRVTVNEISEGQDEGLASLRDKVFAKGVTIQMSAPRSDLSTVSGSFGVEGVPSPISTENFLPRACVIRNTPYVLAAVVYVGEETKTLLGRGATEKKMSRMDGYLNLCIQSYIFLFCVTLAYLATMARANNDKDSWPKKYLVFSITLSHAIPITLYVAWEVLKIMFGRQLRTDKQMIDPDSNIGAVARSVDVLEDLGQIDFIFADKTGTLTNNEVVFARCSIAGQDPGSFTVSENSVAGFDPKMSQSDWKETAAALTPAGLTKTKRILESQEDPLHEPFRRFFTILALCHSVQVEETDVEELPMFTGISTEEVALVEGAHKVGISFRSRTRQTGTTYFDVALALPLSLGESETFTVLHQLPFTSERARMSMIVQHKEEFWYIVKGADSEVEPLLGNPIDSHSSRHLYQFATMGLRTLMVAWKRIPPDALQKWQEEMRIAESEVVETSESRDSRFAELFAKLEEDLEFVGISGAEDGLQFGVQGAVQAVKVAGIRMWVLTGDMVEVAVETARKCMLLPEATQLVSIVGIKSRAEARIALDKVSREVEVMDEYSLVLDGPSLQHILCEWDHRVIFNNIAVGGESCICCRMTPNQKCDLLEFVRDMNIWSVTLAIGDGANDVPMIRAAHVGIGLPGREGSQAVNACDVSLAEFRFMVPLLLCHGRRAYRRGSFFLSWYLYKNLVLLAGDLCWAHQNRFSGLIAYPEYLSMGFNLMFASWHILFIVGYDRDVPDEIANFHPELYTVGPKRKLFRRKVVRNWFIYGVWHGCMAWLIPHEAVCGNMHREQNSMFWKASSVSFTAMVIIVNFRLWLYAQSPCALTTVIPLVVSLGMYFGFIFLVELSGKDKYKATEMFQDSEAMLWLFVTVAVALSVDVVERIARRIFCPSSLQELRGELRLGSDPIAANLLGKTQTGFFCEKGAPRTPKMTE